MKFIVIAFMPVVVLLSFFSIIHAQQPGKQISPPQKQIQSQPDAKQIAADKKQHNMALRNSDDLPDSTLTLKETKDWLREHISGYAGVTSAQGNITVSYRYSSVRFEGNSFLFNVTVKSAVPGLYLAKTNANYPGKSEITGVNEVTIPISEIDPSNIKVVKLPDGKSFGVVLNTVDGKKKIFSKGSVTSKLKTYPGKPHDLFPMFQNDNQDTSDAYNKLTFIFPDEDVANSVAGAFKHAANLSKDENEPFKTKARGK